MRSKLISEEAGLRTFVLVFETGDEAMSELSGFARAQALRGAYFTGIGAFSDVELGYFDWERKDYRPIRLDLQVEVLALTGDVALEQGEPAVHAHVVVGLENGDAKGGHLLQGHVRPTLEVVVTESAAHLRKRYDPASGLALISLDDDGDGEREPQGETSLPHVPEAAANVAGEQAQRLVEEEAATPRGTTEEGSGLDP